MKTLLVSFSLAAVLMSATGCMENGRFGIRGEGPVVERKVNLDRIKGISLPGSAKVFLTQGSSQEVRIEAQENIINNLELEVHGEVWKIGNKRSVWQSDPINIYITLETLKLIRITGSSDVEFVNHFTDLKDVEIRISGSGKIYLDMDARKISASISGSGDLLMHGSAEDLDLGISGSGSMSAFDFKALKADVSISGSGGMELSVKERLDAHISGSGNVFYKGNPRVNTSISGSGSVRAR